MCFALSQSDLPFPLTPLSRHVVSSHTDACLYFSDIKLRLSQIVDLFHVDATRMAHIKVFLQGMYVIFEI